MSLHARSFGHGHDLVMLHGWGLHGEIWGETAERLAESFRVTLVDLPGHGRSSNLEGEYSLTALARAVAAVAPPRAFWLGWSLGGMVAATAAIEMSERVDKLVLVASNPQFVRSSDWPCGLEANVLETFSRDLEHDYHATLMRFLMLQTKGSERAREGIRVLRERLAEAGEPDPAALRGGLAILRHENLRARLGAIGCPTLLLFGSYDVLVPAGAAEAIRCLTPHAHVRTIQGAAHAPFISHPDEFTQVVSSFLHE